MPDPDRLLRRQEQEQERAAAEAAAVEKSRAAAQLEALKREIRNVTADVLALLKAAEYRGMTGVTVDRARLGLKYGGLGYKRQRVAAWGLGDYHARFHGEPYTGTIFLLSSGKFMLSGGHSSGGERDLDDVFLEPQLPLVLSGLRGLLDDLKTR